MKKQLVIMDNSLSVMRLQQRPWVQHIAHSLKPSDLYREDVKARQPIDALIRVHNTGKSPALHAKVLAEWFVDTTNADERDEGVHVPKECTLDDVPTTYKGKPLKEWLMFPDTVNAGAEYRDNVSLSDTDLADIRNGAKTLYMTGCAFYSDGAGSYRTQICMKYDPVRDSPGFIKGKPDYVYRYCLTRNYTEHKEKGKYVRD